MSLGYSIFVRIDFAFNIKNIKEILETGMGIGFEYNELMIKPGNLCELLPLSIEAILLNIQNALVDNDIFIIRVTIEDGSADLLFSNSEGYLGIIFMGMSPEWSKKYIDGEEIDVYRYAHALLNLVNDFKILKMEISKDE